MWYNVYRKVNKKEKGKGKAKLRKDVIEALMKMLNDVNPYVKNFRAARDRFITNKEETFHMRIVSDRVGKDGRSYAMPTTSEVAALIPGDFRAAMPTRDIVIEEKTTGMLQRISEIHPSYLALQYPLILCYGEDGWRPKIEKGFIGIHNNKITKNISMRQWFAFRIQERDNECQTLLRSRRLFQQFVVDSYSAIETNRLGFIKKNQKNMRCENYSALKEASEAGNKKMNE